MRYRFIRLLVLSALVSPLSSVAQVPMTLWSSPALMNSMILNHSTNNFISNIDRRSEELSPSTGATRQARKKSASTIVALSATRGMPAKMASHYPAGQRAQVERTFSEVLDGYRKIESQFGIPRNDLAGAVAAFLAGSYMAYNDVDFPDEHFKPLVSQMRQTIASNAEFQAASDVEKQDMYEQMAILGTSLALTRDALKAQPNPQIASTMKQAAKGYLEQFLKTDADKVDITAAGLVIR